MPDGALSSPQIDFKLRPIIAPRYKFTKLPMSNVASSNVGLGTSSASPMEWKLPANVVYNLARSYIQYNLNVPGQANGYTATAEDVFEIPQTVSFGSPGGQDLVSLQWASNLTKIARKISTPMEDFLTNDDMSSLYKCNTSATSNPVPGGGSASTAAPAGFLGTDGFTEPKYMALSSVIGNGSATGQTGRLDRYRQIPLSAFSGTLLAVDRDFFSPTEMSFRILSNIGDKMAWLSQTPADASGVQSSILNIPANTCSTAGQNITINNCYLYLCVEQNQDIINAMFERYRSGDLKYSIPYTTSFRLTGAASGGQTNLQVTLSNMYGRKLKRILTTMWNPAERINTSYDCSNFNGAKLSSYQTMLNSRPLQDRVLSCMRPAQLSVNQDDWLENFKFVDKQSCYTSKEMYNLNWFHIDQFYEPRDSSQLVESNLSEGLDMVVPVTWQFSGVAGMTGVVFYIYAEFQREIMITPSGPIFSPIV
jgi:hypothetical protein